MKKPCNDDSSINIKCRSNSVNNNRKSFFGLSLRLIFTIWCLLFFFYSKLGLTHVNGGNSDADNRGIPNPSVCDEKGCYLADGSENHTNGMVLEFNISMNCSNSTVLDHDSANSTFSLAEANGLEVIVWSILRFTDLVCELQPKEEQKKDKLGKLQNEKTHPAYLNLDEFRSIARQEKEWGIPSRLVNITHRLEPDGTEYNYASASKGAKVLAHNKEAKGASNILGKDHDKYLRNPCSVDGKFVVIELVEETLVDAVKIANFEHYSSNFKEFQLSGSLIYPTETWSPLGNFVAANVKHAQSFKLPEPKWVRYLKLNLLGHYGSEFYCTLSVLEVYGIDAIERMLEDLIVASAESATNKLPNPNTTEMSSLKPEPGPSDQKRDGEVQNVVEAADKGIETVDNGQRLNIEVISNPMTMSTIPDPVMEVRQLSNGKIPGDSVLKILMQKVLSLELNLSVLEEYIKELNRRQGDVLPELDKELSKISLLLEKSKTEIKDLLEWKEIMDKGIADLESWKATVSSRLNALVRENGMLRLDVERVASDQVSLEKKELAVLVVSFFFACIAILKLVSERAMMFFGSPVSDKVCETCRGWVLILVSCSMTIFITLLCS
uniref:SUN domain-containing protein n=1 Tax=Davidia involucrata TaxID=16924 RepID=A0A5B7ADY6_DAVIN